MNCAHLFLKKMIWWSFISIMERKRQNAKELLQEQIFIGYMGILKQLNMTFWGRIMKTIEKSVYISILMRII